MRPMRSTTELMPIGRFARLSGLTVKALRHYAEIGLLEPAWVDPDTGYRWYSLVQARAAEAIRRLRRLAVPLDEIRALVGAGDEVVRERLLAHRAWLEGQAVETRRILVELQRLIDGEEELVPESVRIKFELSIQEVAEQRFVAVTEDTHSDAMGTIVPRAIDEVRAYLAGLRVEPSGPPICICPFADDEGRLQTQIGWPVAAEVPGRGRIEATTLPAVRALVLKHTGPYEELSRSYRLMSEAMELHDLTPAGAPRELYVTDPDDVPDQNDHETVIVWPIGPEGNLEPKGDFFMRRVEA